ncbi:hypothetical protein MFLO_14202 [Listeria floridensis FSL S10-1187]|uniref:Uncharacterized protein n=1 Tax=Listeria floridensis FSL S10-1187 TaxID=1265817 RepID=A0ABP3AX66_9LIST|nr:hypothetical protein [Listeria floridensis]EUJ26117.1 hypothetical protein MFLO_14202 [Listeria floridensis FSL S10-1187]
MNIPFAKVGQGDDSYSIGVVELSKHPDLEKIKQDLWCTELGCECRLLYSTYLSRPILKTWKNQNHSEDCMYYFERNEAKRKKSLF